MTHPSGAECWLRKKMSIKQCLLHRASLAMLFLLTSFVLGGWHFTPLPKSALPEVVEAQSAASPLQVKGKLIPDQYVSLSLSQGGRVAEIYAHEGQKVEIGDLILLLDGYEQSAAEVAAAELEMVLARQALDALYDVNPVMLAEVELSIAEAQKDLALARDHYTSISKPRSQAQIEQAYANLKLSENQLNIAQKDLEKAQKRFKNKKSLIWRFINQRQVKLRLTLLEQEVASLERRYLDAQEKYQDLLAPPDEIDLALAQTRMNQIQAHLNHLEQRRLELLTGPDPDEEQAAQARLTLAEARLASAKIALQNAQITAPMGGILVDLKAKPGEWLSGGTPFAVIAELNRWKVEISEISETQVTQIRLNQPVSVKFNALPDLSLSAHIDSIDLLSIEDDGDTFYKTYLHTDQSDPRLRWGMTVQAEFLPAPGE